jgi:hypothetical protein
MSDKSAIEVSDYLGGTFRVRVLARCGAWVVHKTIKRRGGYTVTHEPSSLAAVTMIASLRRARQALREFASLPGDWTFTSEGGLSKRQIRAGRAVKRRYESETGA